MPRNPRRQSKPARASAPSPGPPAAASVSEKSRWLVPLLLFAVTVVAYLPCLRGEFIWDDGAWTTNAEYYLRDLRGLWEIWTNPTAMQQYYPVSATSFWLDWNLWREWTLPYHLENVLLHAAAAALFWRVLVRLNVPGALLAAFLFALHPMMVESVAWITERKNVLSLVLMLLSFLFFESFTATSAKQRDPSARKRRRLHYGCAFLLFAAALLAKITAFVLPPAFLLIAWWKHGRLQWRRDVRPTLPFFALAIGLGVLVTWLEKHHVGAEGADFDLSWTERCLLAGRAFWFYPAKLLWPLDVRLFYPKWPLDPVSLIQWLWPVSVVAALAVAWQARQRLGRGVVVAVVFYFGAALPILGFLNVYGMFLADVADRWVYVPALSLIALAAAGVARLTSRHARARWLPWLVLPALGVLTWRHAGNYSTEEGFWRAAIVHNPAAWIARNNLGSILARRGAFDEAAAQLQRAIELRPNYAEAWCNQANLLRETGRMDESLVSYREALRHRPDDYPDAHNNLGLTLMQMGRRDEAEPHFRKAIEIQPLHVLAHNNLGNLLLHTSQPEAAIASYQSALEINPDHADTHNNIGMALLQQMKPAEAVTSLQRAIALRPDHAEAINNLGHAFMQLNRPREAVAQFEAAIQARPSYAQAHHNLGIARYLLGEVPHTIAAYRAAIAANPRQTGSLNNLAWILATFPDDSLRDGKQALALAEQAIAITGDRDATVLHTLAAALAENGRFDEAAQAARRSLELAIAQNNGALAEAVRDQLRLYEARQPFRDSAP